MILSLTYISFFFFNDTATTEIYTLSLHDALPICGGVYWQPLSQAETNANAVALFWSSTTASVLIAPLVVLTDQEDRKSTRLNSSHQIISYAVFCLKKKKTYAKSCAVELQLQIVST